MNLFESLVEPFLSTKIDKKADYSIADPLKITDELGSDIDLGMLVATNSNLPYDVRKKELTVDQQLLMYRRLAMSAEASVIIDEIVNEVYNTAKDELPRLRIDGYDMPKALEKKIDESFKKILNIMDFRRNGNNIIRQWYVDGHLFMECIYDNKKPKDGIKFIGVLEPLGMSKEFDDQSKRFKYRYTTGTNSYFGSNVTDMWYDQEQVVYINSGFKDELGKIVSYLHPALKINNQMQMIEDMLVVYRITRGSEKRAIKVNVGNMPKTKAVSYMTELVNKFRYKKQYNTTTGQVENNSHLMAVTEDIWLPTKNSTKDIEIDTLQGGMQLGELDDLIYFKNKLMHALRVPSNRFNDDNTFDITATEINRQEARFAQFVSSLRMKFNEIFIELLRRDLVASGAVSEPEFLNIKKYIRFIYPDESMIAKREYFSNLNQKIDLLGSIESYVGKYYSEEYIRKNILDQTETEIEEIKKQIDAENKMSLSSLDGSGQEGQPTNEPSLTPEE